MESAGPMTRSRARHGDPGSSSAAPSTRKKGAARSSRKSVTSSKTPPASPKPASRVEDVPVEEADDTAVATDIPEATSNTGGDAPDTVLLADASEPHDSPPHPGSAAIGGLTPAALPTSTPGGTPVGYGPSPVVPIKLDSLWTPHSATTAQQAGSSPYVGFSPLAATTGDAAAAGAPATTGGKSAAGSDTVDLASMFISTPAAAPGSSSPVGGLVAEAAEAPAATAAKAPTPQQQQQQLETPSANDHVLMGSPAPPGTFAFAEPAASAGMAGGMSSPAALPAATAEQPVQHGSTSSTSSASAGSTPVPSAPLLPSQGPAGTPGFDQDTPLPALPTETPAGGKTPATAGGGSGSTTPGAEGGGLVSPMLTEDPDTPLPPATAPDFDEDAEYSVPAVLDPDMRSSTSPTVLSHAGTPAAVAASPMSAVQQQRRRTPAAAAAISSSPMVAASAATAAEAAEIMDDAEMMAAAARPQDEERFEHELLQEAAVEVDLLAQQLQAVPTDSSGTEQHSAEGHGDDDDEDMMASDGEVSMEPEEAAAAVLQCGGNTSSTAMEASFGSPADAAVAAVTPKASPAAVTSPGARYRSSSATTAAPPKSALAKPKSGSSSAAPKHAHVVIPDAASPKTAPPGSKATAARKAAAVGAAPGSAAARFGHAQSSNAGSSPGHTPFPSKSKIRAATAAAERGSSCTAAAAKAPSHKKEMALAAAHSALKRYSKAAGEAAEGSGSMAAAAAVTSTPPTSGTAAAPGRRNNSPTPSPTIPNVSSRLMQPTASSSAKARYSGASDGPDALMWSPPGSSATEPAAAASPARAPAAAVVAAASSRPRLASKIVVPSPAARAAEPSMKALKRSIKSKVADKAKATVQEARADSMADDAVRSSKVASSKGSKELRASRKAAAAAAEEALDLDVYEEEDEYGEDYYEQAGDCEDVDALADTMAGLSVKPVRVAQPRGPLKGVAAPVGRHFRFDEEGNAMETPVSRQRRAPRHTKFDEDGNPLPQQQLEQPRWR